MVSNSYGNRDSARFLGVNQVCMIIIETNIVIHTCLLLKNMLNLCDWGQKWSLAYQVLYSVNRRTGIPSKIRAPDKKEKQG